MGINKLFTIQDPIVLDIIKEKGIYVSKNMPKERYSTTDTSIAYLFMSVCMRHKIPILPPRKARNPIWAWPMYNDDPIGKLINRKTHKRGKYVRIEFEKHTPDILCSNYTIWKKVLKGDYIDSNFKDPPDAGVIKEFKNMGLIRNYQEEIKVWSWFAMFDGDKMVRNMKDIQVSLWSISEDEITNIQEIRL